MTQTTPSLSAAVQQLMAMADKYADSSAQVSLDKFVNKIDDAPARAVMLVRYECLEAAHGIGKAHSTDGGEG